LVARGDQGYRKQTSSIRSRKGSGRQRADGIKERSRVGVSSSETGFGRRHGFGHAAMPVHRQDGCRRSPWQTAPTKQCPLTQPPWGLSQLQARAAGSCSTTPEPEHPADFAAPSLTTRSAASIPATPSSEPSPARACWCSIGLPAAATGLDQVLPLTLPARRAPMHSFGGLRFGGAPCRSLAWAVRSCLQPALVSSSPSQSASTKHHASGSGATGYFSHSLGAAHPSFTAASVGAHSAAASAPGTTSDPSSIRPTP
jgi:hypothetical protein